MTDGSAPRFVAGVEGVLRSRDDHTLRVVDSGLPGTPAIDEGTRFRVGSLAKPFTALGVLKLVEQGALTLDDPLTRWIPEFRIRSDFKSVEPIRIRHLLSHSSGLPVEARAELMFERSWPLAELLPLLAEHTLVFPTGQRAQYSNVGYDLLGLVIERVSGQAFERYMGERIFAPLEMTTAGYAPDRATVPGYFRSARGELLVGPTHPPNDLPGGGLVLSARDFVAFLRWLLGPGAPALKRLLLSPSGYLPLAGVRQQPGVPALGFYVEDRFGRRMAFHTGGQPGCLAYCHALPDAGRACFTFLTGPLAPVGEIWEHHLENVKSLVVDAGSFGPASAGPALGHATDARLGELASHEPSPEELAACAGRYGVPGFYDVAFTSDGRTLRTDYGEIGELVAVAPYEFVAARYLPGERVRFVKSEAEPRASAVYVSLTLHTRLEGERLERHQKLKAERFG